MKTWIFVVVLGVTALMLWGNKRAVAEPQGNVDEDSVENESVSGYGTGNVTQGSWLELFLGMDQIEEDNGDNGYVYRYVCRAPEFEECDDIVSQELKATWYGLSQLSRLYFCQQEDRQATHDRGTDLMRKYVTMNVFVAYEVPDRPQWLEKVKMRVILLVFDCWSLDF